MSTVQSVCVAKTCVNPFISHEYIMLSMPSCVTYLIFMCCQAVV